MKSSSALEGNSMKASSPKNYHHRRHRDRKNRKQNSTLTPLNVKKKVHEQQRASSSIRIENHKKVTSLPSFVPTLHTVSKVALMSAAAPSEIQTSRSPKNAKSWRMRVPNVNNVRGIRSPTAKIKSTSFWKESYDKASSDLSQSLRYGTLGQRDVAFREDHNDWYLRIHQGAKSVHTPERTTRRKMNVIF